MGKWLAVFLVGTSIGIFVTLMGYTSHFHPELANPHRAAPVATGPNESYFKTFTGFYLFAKQWPVPNPKGLIFLSHGYGEHIGRYEHVAKFFNHHGFTVLGMDHQGHGRSEGERAYTQRFEQYFFDYLDFVYQYKGQYNESLPRFLIGHSMGGTIALQTVLRDSGVFGGVVLSAPAVVPDPSVATPLLVTLSTFLSLHLPKIPLTRIDTSKLSRDPSVGLAYEQDPLVYHGGFRARLAQEFMDAMSLIQREAGEIKVPILLLHGSEDKLTLAEGSTFLMQHLGSSDKELKLYPGLYHEIFNEPEREKVFKDILTWIQKRI